MPPDTCAKHEDMVVKVSTLISEVHTMKESFADQKADSKELLTRFEVLEKKALVWSAYLTIGVAAVSWCASHTDDIKAFLS